MSYNQEVYRHCHWILEKQYKHSVASKSAVFKTFKKCRFNVMWGETKCVTALRSLLNVRNQSCAKYPKVIFEQMYRYHLYFMLTLLPWDR